MTGILNFQTTFKEKIQGRLKPKTACVNKVHIPYETTQIPILSNTIFP